MKHGRPSARIVNKDRGYARIEKLVQQTHQPHVVVGILEGESHGEDEMTVAAIASVHEFGSEDGSIPERSFLRSTADEKRGDHTEKLKLLSGGVLTGKLTQQQALDRFGVYVVAQVKEKIRAGIEPPLAPETIERKGSSTPLIDTAQMINSITHRVEGT